MIVIGLTGGIASGKSTVSNLLQKLGAKIIDADLIAREIVKPKEPAWQEIKEFFGPEILQPDLFINRKKLGEIVFSKKEALEKLNQITHPKILKRVQEVLTKYRHEGSKVSVIDAALLIETGMHAFVDELWVVKVSLEEQINRVMNRDEISKEEALKRISSQSSLDEKLRLATRVIDNSGNIEDLKSQIMCLWKELLNDQKDCINCPR